MSESVLFMSTWCTVHKPNSSSISHRRVGRTSGAAARAFSAHQKSPGAKLLARRVIFCLDVLDKIYSLFEGYENVFASAQCETEDGV